MTNTQLQWKAPLSCTCMHVAEALHSGANIVDASLAAAAIAPAEALSRLLSEAGLAPERLWEHLAPLSAEFDNNLQLAQIALRKTIGAGGRADVLAPRLADCIAALENAVRLALPQLGEELQLRGGPLRQQWEARGPGLLRRVGKLTEEALIVERADVLLVRPVLGGGGKAHLSYNSVRMEAVLANPHDKLPETLRLGWLIAQLNNDLPVFSDQIHRHRLPMIAALAMIPVVLEAAEHVELARRDDAALRLALDAWRVAAPADVDIADVLTRWWETYVESRPPWKIALAALDQMIP